MGKEYLYFSNKNTFLVRLLFLSLTGLPCMLGADHLTLEGGGG